MQIVPTFLAVLLLAALAVAEAKSTVWVTETELVTVVADGMSELTKTLIVPVERQNDGFWWPDASFPVAAPTSWAQAPSEPVWTKTSVPPQKTEGSIPKTPGDRAVDKGKMGMGIIIGCVAGFIGLALLGCTSVWMKRHGWCCSCSRSVQKSKGKANVSLRDLEAARGIDNTNVAYPPRVARPEYAQTYR